MLPKPEDPKEKDEAAGVVLDGAKLELGRGENEKPEPAGLAAVALDPNEKEGALVEGVLDDAEAGVDAGLPKLKVGRAEEEDVEAGAAATEEGAAVDGVEVAGALEEAPLVAAGLNGVALLLSVLGVLATAEADVELLFSMLSRCLRY